MKLMDREKRINDLDTTDTTNFAGPRTAAKLREFYEYNGDIWLTYIVLPPVGFWQTDKVFQHYGIAKTERLVGQEPCTHEVSIKGGLYTFITGNGEEVKLFVREPCTFWVTAVVAYPFRNHEDEDAD